MAITTLKRICDSLSFSKIQPWLVCLSAALFFFYEFIQMGMFNSISQELMHDFSINASQLGFLSATYFYADVIFLLFAGILVDRFSIRIIILSAMVMVVLSTILFSLSRSFEIAAFSHFIAGIGNAFCFLSCIKLATRWFSSQRLALVIGIIITIAMAGGIVAQTPFALVVHALGWRTAVMMNAGLGIFITLLVYFFVYDYPKHQLSQKMAENKAGKPISVIKSISLSLQNKQNTLAGIYTCLLNLPIILLGALWGTLYLTQVHHLEKTRASLVATMIFLGTIIGSPLLGWFSDFIGRRRLLMIIGAMFSLLVLLIIMFTPVLHYYTLLILFLLLGFFTSTQIISYPLIAESNPRHLTGTSTSLASILIMGGGAVFQPLFGWLIDLHWDQTFLQGAPFYSPGNYRYGMAIMPIAFLVSLLAACCLRETFCQPFIRENNLC
ncbi:MFS transporter [Rickettsiella endosymbiont of Rhagonycha lignosa]|uniref:MFS transporter n=1 Tax=Rickettsiella endosymbiont of Rhagonycha lignosa TaxID=3077937 RepID=UPI00313E51CC